MNQKKALNDNICYMNYYAIFEIVAILIVLVIYFSTMNSSSPIITGDTASAIFYVIILVILTLGVKKAFPLSKVSEQSIPYYLVSNFLALLYAVVSLLSKIASLFDQWLNGGPASIYSMFYPLDVFLLLSIIMSVLLPILYKQSRKKLGVK